MKKMRNRILVCGLLALLGWSMMLIADRKKLSEGLIRFHVVAHSDSETDQMIKIRIRDAVINSIQSDLQNVQNVDEARQYLMENIPKIQDLVDRTLEEMDFAEGSTVSLCKEAFDIRHYDTFSLPAGIYDSFRIVIGDGMGRNWWCVSFPSLCIPATSSGFESTAVSAGFSRPLVKTLSDDDYKIRFFLLNQLGKLENILFQD